MKENIELEYKLLVTRDKYIEIRNFYNNKPSVRQENLYYSNDDCQRRKIAIRLRYIDNKTIFTLKMHDEDKNLIEHEKLTSCEHPLENDPEIKALLDKLLITNLEPLVTIVTYRTLIPLENAELCIDLNQYDRITDYEIEYEVKKEHDSVAAFKNILKEFDLEYVENCPTKLSRALKTHKEKKYKQGY